MSVNKAILIGNLGNDPELRSTPSGTTVCNFSLATSENYKGESKTEWHRCVAFNKTAEIINQYLTKGSKIYVEGKIQTSSYEKDGVKRYSTEIIVNQMQFLDSRVQDSGASKKDEQAKPSVNTKAAASSFDDFSDEDLPF